MVIFGLSIGNTAQIFVREKNDGTLDRLFAAGISSFSIILGAMLSHTLILLVQVILMLIILLLGFQFQVVGSLGLLFSLVMLLGLDGMGVGVLIASVAESEVAAGQITVGTYFPCLMLSGVMWPISAIPKWFVWISYLLPTTWAAEAARSVMIRGWGLAWAQVWAPFLILFVWLLGVICLSVLSMPERERRHLHLCTQNQHKYKK